ncbi:MAG TPA: prepilin-type N-terminal cleavage/methylation domain-containing protein, partial [Pyrinomonadaceae bacterium]|nr:prepilin-type N-terminal cleavage/methylation domain-containing protein [Pyrinomonadaceae bacterium]
QQMTATMNPNSSKNLSGHERAGSAPPAPRNGAPHARAGERGYTLVALLAVMTILALALTAAAPRMRQQSQRNLEREAIARGEEIAEAIALYQHAKQKPPSSMNDLLEGVEPFPGAFKKIQILRAEAARDPLNNDGDWKLIRPNDRAFQDFQRAVLKYNGGVPPVTSARYQAFRDFGVVQGGVVLGLDNDDEKEDARCELDTSANETTTPFIGVASRSRCRSVMTYYGIERHDRWIFTPVYR